jgi:hypothetical protein
MSCVENLGPFEQAELLRWFLHHMSHEARGDLMATYPQHYAKLHPNVSPAVMTERVSERLAISAGTERPAP